MTPKIRRNAFLRRWTPLPLLALLTLPALLPLLRRTFTCGFDTTFHLWRAVEIGALLREGVLFSRWAPHMAHGYGYPLYLFQSPLSAYAAALLNLTGLGWPLAVNLTYAAGLLGAAWAAWWLARDLWGERAGLVTAVTLTFIPFHLYVVFYRASLSETVAWIFPPLALWGLRRWLLHRQATGLATAVLTLLLLYLTHDVTAYLFLPFFVVWVVGIGWQQRRGRGVVEGLLALGLALAAGAVFWLPALAERGLIQFDRAGGAWPFLPQNNFLPLTHLLALPRVANPAWLNEWPPRGLGALPAALALAGVWLGWRRGKAQRWETAVLGLILAGTLFLITPLSRPLWLHIDLLAAFQFPWRFLSPAALAAALLAGAALSPPPQPKLTLAPSPYDQRHDLRRVLNEWGAALVVIGLLSLLHWGWLSPDRCQPPADTSLAGMVQWERDTRTLGTTASRELLPVTVAQLPQEPDAPPPWTARLLPQALPDGAAILSSVERPLATTIILTSPTPFTARYRAFAFPGWRARVNGEPVTITPTEPEGLISFPVPAGESTLDIAFGETPPRRAGTAVTLLALAAAAFIAWRGRHPSPTVALRFHSMVGAYYGAVLLLGLALLLGRLVVLALPGDGRSPTPDVSQSITFGTAGNPAQLQLLGHDALPPTLPADRPLTVTLTWQALVPLDGDYRVGLTLLDANGNRLSSIDLRDERWSRTPPPTQAWPTDQFVTTAFYVDVLPGTPPTETTLALTFFEAGTFEPLTAFDANGQPLGPAVTLGEIALTPPRTPWTLADLDLAHTFSLAADGGTIVGAAAARTQAAPGDPLSLTLAWSPAETAVPTAVATAISAELLLLDEAENETPLQTVTLPHAGAGVWRQEINVQLPVTLADGRYTWALRSGGAQATWGALRVEGPQRTMTPPPFATAVDVTLGERATLVGYSLSPLTAGEPAEVILIWRGETVMETGYRVFVHLVDGNGRILAQSDGIPANWTRPTTGWLPGEYITDTHTLDVPLDEPSGSYDLRVGMYGPDGVRLLTTDGVDRVQITEN